MPPWEPQPHNFFTHLTGVPVGFDRAPPQYPYGQRVDTEKQKRKFHCLKTFQAKLETCFSELWTVCPLGKAEQIISAGTYVAKPQYHGMGRAFDLDGIFWVNRSFVALKYPTDRKFYLAVEAVLRKHFGLVLDYNYNAAHRDHFHVDDGDAPGFEQNKQSEVGFVQASLRDVLGYDVAVTGSYDNFAMKDALHKLNAGDLRHRESWFTFLDRVATLGFEGEGGV